MSPDRITFTSFDGKTTVQIGHGHDCVVIQIEQPNVQYAGIVLTADEADRFVRSLRRQVKFSRIVRDDYPDQVAG